MKLTTRGRFAVTSMIDLALYAEQGPVRLVDIARRQHISLAYLEQIFCKLRRAKLVRSIRGPGGGYQLGREASLISAADIVEAVEGRMDASQCHGTGACRGGSVCLGHALWNELNEEIANFLRAQSLESIKNRGAQRLETEHTGCVPVTFHTDTPCS